MSADPAVFGARVLAALEAGRQRQLADRQFRAAELRELVLRAGRLDRANGKPDRGRAGRVARRLQLTGVTITDRWVRTILSELTDTSSALHASDVIRLPQRQPITANQ